MGTLSVVSTPIGNLEDITIRAIKTLFAADIILCEDTRRSGLLLDELKKRYPMFIVDHKAQLISYYDEIEDKRIPEIIQMLEDDRSIALISDAGTPLVSDPGFRLARECLKRNIKVESIPGASAVLAALTSSGLPSDKFTFLGYPPEKPSARVKLFESLKSAAKHTYIFYCAPHKLTQTLMDAQSSIGDVEIVLARELTKVHEEIWRGTISEARVQFPEPKGEFVLLFAIS